MNSPELVDILSPRRHRNDAFSFMSRYWSPQKTYNALVSLNPQQLKSVVLNSLYIQSVIDAESVRTGKSKDNLRCQVEDMLNEIGLDRKVRVIRWLGILFIKTALMMNVGVLVNERNIFKLKSMLGSCPVLLLPTHRSYADFILMQYLCFHYDIELPGVAAGKDFQSMALMGSAMRNAGAFYMRRTLTGDTLYAATLTQYLRVLVAKYHLPVEFFIEGTRSRTNKTLPPKYGMLSMVLTPLFRNEVPDITLVPIAISYDRLVEQTLFAYEHVGVPKPKETTGALLRSYNALKDNYGNININIGSPFSIRQYFNNDFKQTREQSSKPLDLQDINPDQFNMVQKLAQDVISIHQELNITTLFNLIAIVMMNSLVISVPVMKSSILSELKWMSEVLGMEGDSSLMNDEMYRVLNVHKSWLRFDKDDSLKLIVAQQMILTDDIRKKMKGSDLKAETLIVCVPVIQLQLYVNPVMCKLLPSAILVTQCNTSHSFSRVELYQRFCKLRKMLKHELFYMDERENEVFNKAMEFCVTNECLRLDNDNYSIGDNIKTIQLFNTLLWPFLMTLKFTAQVMKKLVTSELKSACKVIQEFVESSEFYHPYCLSLETIANTMYGYTYVNAMRKELRNNSTHFTVVENVLNDCMLLLDETLPDIKFKLTRNSAALMGQPRLLSRL